MTLRIVAWVLSGGLLTATAAQQPKQSVFPSEHTPPPPNLPTVPLTSKSVLLDNLLKKEVWTWSTDQFSAAFPPGSFSWVTEKHDRAVFLRVPKQGEKIDLRLGGALKPVEATVDFANGRPRRVDLVIYSHGDGKSLTKEEFNLLVQHVSVALTTIFGPPTAEAASRIEKKVIRLENTHWATDFGRLDLETSARKNGDFRAEFVRVRFTPPGEDTAAKPAVRSDLVKNVKRETSSGDVWVDGVPMVDQGAKGYCVLASCQRLFEYYGITIDQHELAQLTGASRGGTSLLKMQEALHRIDGRMKVRVRTLIAPLSEQADYNRLMQDYNQAAKKAGQEELDYRKVTYDLATLDPALLREAKLKGAGYDKFVKAVREATDRGVPLLWALELGMFPEVGKEPKQKSTSHMRLIIGYNAKTRQILFSDTWGQGHELKRMAAADAFAATMGLYLMEPLQK